MSVLRSKRDQNECLRAQNFALFYEEELLCSKLPKSQAIKAVIALECHQRWAVAGEPAAAGRLKIFGP